MNFKKKILSVFMCAALAYLAFYGSTKEMKSAQEVGYLPLFGNEKETIYFWYSDDGLTDYINDAAVSFGEQRKVRVIPVLVSGSQYLEVINRATFTGEQMPDAFLISNDSLEKAYLAGLADQVDDGGNICNNENFPQAALLAVNYHGKTIGYPLFYETNALIYNSTYLDEWARQQAAREIGEEEEPIAADGVAEEDAPDLPEEGMETSGGLGETETISPDDETIALKAAEYRERALPDTVSGVLGFADTFDAPEGLESIMEWDVTDIFYNYWFVGNYMVVGGDAGDDEAALDFDNEETKNCLRYYASLNQFFSIDGDSVNYESVLGDFMEGKIIFTVGTTDAVKVLEDAKKAGKLDFEYGIAPMPDVTDVLKSRSMSVTEAVVVSSYSFHKELANEFAAYLVTEKADDLYAWTGKVSACRKVAMKEENQNFQAFFEEYSESVPLSKLMKTGNFWMNLEALFYEVWNGADVDGKLLELKENMTIG